MLNDSALSFLSLPWAHEEPLGNGGGDLAEIFDDREDFQDFSPPDSLVHHHAPGHNMMAVNQVLKSVTTGEVSRQHPTPLSLSHLAQQHASANAQPSSLVNLQMIVDPISGKVTYPKQVITYDVGGGKMENVVFGPVTLDGNTPSDSPCDNHANATNPETPNFADFQQISHSVFMPVSPSPTPSANDSAYAGLSSTTSTNSNPSCFAMIPVVHDAESPPLRALSAYNFFFRDERDRILHGGMCEWTSDKQAQLLAAHWQQDRSKKRRHRKTHGKINFTTLSKLVSQRWKDLEEGQKQFYRQVAAQDFERYQREMDEYKKRLGKPITFQHVVG